MKTEENKASLPPLLPKYLASAKIPKRKKRRKAVKK